MSVRELVHLTWEEARELPPARTVAILPVGAIEAHGPHLPLGTDLVIARAMARAGAERLAVRGVQAVLLPGLAFTAAPFAAAFPGTLSAAPGTVTEQVLGLARELTRHRFAALAVANAHLDPAHLASLDQAQAMARDEALLPIVFPNLVRRAIAERLGDEFRSGACHAGRFESSVVMAERPELVREAERRALPSNPASLTTAIRDGAHSFEQAGGPRAYFGWPAEASVEEGRLTVATLGDILCEAVVAAVALEPGP